MTIELQELIISQATDLVNANADGISENLRTEPEGKLSVSFAFKLALVKNRVYSTGAIGYSRKFKDSVEGSSEFDDPDQEKLPLPEAAMKKGKAS